MRVCGEVGQAPTLATLAAISVSSVRKSPHPPPRAILFSKVCVIDRVSISKIERSAGKFSNTTSSRLEFKKAREKC